MLTRCSRTRDDGPSRNHPSRAQPTQHSPANSQRHGITGDRSSWPRDNRRLGPSGGIALYRARTRVRTFEVVMHEASPSFEDLYRRHWRGVFGAAYRVLGRVAEADDVAQEVFTRHWR
ncbi:MAG: RNA polymerase sigma factor, partial [Solirubrobacteraceae bacterium]